MALLITLTSTTFPLTLSAPVRVNDLPQLNYENAMPREEDIFNGGFSQRSLNLVPYQPQEVSFSINPTMDIPYVRVRFIFPGDFVKGSIVQAQGGIYGGYVWRGGVKRGETLTLLLSIVAEEEIEASVRAYVEASSGGKMHRASYYLRVTTLTEPEIVEGKAGKTRQVSLPKDVLTPSNSEAPRAVKDAQSSSNSASPGTIRIKGRFVYVNEDGGYSPARAALVWLRDDDTGTDEWVAYQWTDYNGNFDFTVDNDDGFLQDGRDPYVQLWSEGQWDSVCKTSGGDTYHWNNPKAGNNVDDGFFYDYGTRVPTSNNEAMQIIDAILTEADWIWARTSPNWEFPGKVIVYWPYEDWPHSHGSEIHMPSKSTASWGHVTMHHEFAHSVMWSVYGNKWPPGFEGGTHWVWMEDVLTDAWVEGWAEFMQCAVDNDPNNLQNSGMNIETNTWFNLQDSGDMDGAYIEGSIASILWDILDPTSTADRDHLYASYNYIFTVARYDNPSNILEFWTDWITRWSDLTTSKGPLSTIYWHYGIDRDFYAPWGSISIKGGAPYTTSTSVILTLSASDWGSGVASMRFSNVYPYVWGSWVTYTTSKSWTLSTGDGTKTVYVQFKDNKGFTSGVSSDTIILDTVEPVTAITHYPGSSTVSLSATDATSGVDKTYYRIDSGLWIIYTGPFALTGTGTHTINYHSKDNAGNTETTKSLTLHFLTVNTDPAGITTISGTGWYADLLVATTGTAPATVTTINKVYTFSTWKIDGTEVTGNPVSVVMDAPHTATATYTEETKASIAIATDKTTYHERDVMNVSLGLKTGSVNLPVRIIVALMFPDGSILITLDVTLTLPAGLDTRLTLHTITLPSLPTGRYYWLAFLFDPDTMEIIAWDYATWTFEAPASSLVAIPSLQVKIP